MLQVLHQEVNLGNPTCAMDEDLKPPRYKYKTGFCVFQKIIFDKKAFYPISILKYEQIQQMY